MSCLRIGNVTSVITLSHSLHPFQTTIIFKLVKDFECYVAHDKSNADESGGLVLRMDQARIPKVALPWTPPGKRKPGRPKTTWRQTVMPELSEVKLTWGEAQHAAKNRDK